MENEMRKYINKVKNFSKNKNFSIKEIKYFSPDGRNTLPNGSIYQKGGFLNECRINKESFSENNYQYFIDSKFIITESNILVTEAVHQNQYGLFDYRGGIIIFSTDVNSLILDKNKLINWLKNKILTLKNRLFTRKKLGNIISKFNLNKNKKIKEKQIEDYIGAFSIGNFFKGTYISDNEKQFNEKSLSIEINGISTEALIYLAEEIAIDFKQETVLVKDLNKNKIFLVDKNKEGNYNLDNINTKV
jgi:hypothetical protein